MDIKRETHPPPNSEATEVFISYARKDKDFVRRLHEALAKRGRDTWVDWEDIPLTAEWLAEIYSGIESADAFVFVISPDSAASKVCRQELAHAVEHHKRLIPIVRRDVDDKDVPPPLSSYNWIFVRQGDDFDEAFQSLMDAIDTDLDWVREHTRLLERAIEWDKSGRDTSFVLRGSDLRAAEEWQARAADKDPKPTQMQTEYILASRRAATRRQRITLGAVTLGFIVAAVLGVIAWLARIEAVEQREAAERQASIALGRQLAAQAQLSAEQEPVPLQRSVLLALEAGQQSPVPSFEAQQVLRDALTVLPRSVARLSHAENVNEVAFSPDGKHLATASGDWTARVWDATSGEEVTRLEHDGPVGRVAFSPDGKYLVTGGGNTFHVWEALSGDEVESINLSLEGGPPPIVQDVVFSPDGEYILTAMDKTVRVWDPANGDEIARMEGGESVDFSQDSKYLAASDNNIAYVHDLTSDEEVAHFDHESAITHVALDPSGHYLATRDERTIRVWNVTSGEEAAHMTHAATTAYFDLSSDGKYLAAAGYEDRTARVWEVASGEEVARITHEDNERHIINSIAFSPDGEYLATAGADNTAHLWDPTSTREFVAMNEGADVQDVAYSPDGKYLAGAIGGGVRVWNPSTGEVVTNIATGIISSAIDTGELDVLDFSPDGRYLAVGSSTNVTKLLAIPSGEEGMHFTHDASATSVAFSPDGRYLAIGGTNNNVWVWDATTGEEIAHMTHGDTGGGDPIADISGGNDIVDITFSPDGDYLATVNDSELARVWETTRGDEVARLVHDNGAYVPGNATRVVFSPDGDYLATASDDQTARVWDPISGEEIARLEHEGSVTSVTFSPDGKYLATTTGGFPRIPEAAEPFDAHLWDPATGEEVARMTHDNHITMGTFSPDGEYLATSSYDETARVWDTTNGEEVARFARDENVQDVAFSPDGRYLAIASAGMIHVQLWRTPEDLAREACTRLTRNLTREEWQQYLDNVPYHKTCANVPRPVE